MGRIVAMRIKPGTGYLCAWLAILFSVALFAAAPAWADELEEFDDDPFAGYEDIEEDNDPLEIPNRFVFAFNQALDFALIRPIAWVYREAVPQLVRDSVRNFLRNLKKPVILANDFLQGDLERARITTVRFVINTTGGLLGFFDLATDEGYPYHSEDFGQTLGTWGVGEGVYLVLPLLGPSSARDATGRVVDHFLDPLTYLAQDQDKEEWLLYRTALEGLDFRARNIDTLDEIERDSLDFYARLRSLYRQHREAEINNMTDADSEGETGPYGPRATTKAAQE
jgi:phospholipid-binding lipoprotein MlaA